MDDNQCPITNIHIYKFSNNNFYVSFDTERGREEFSGTHAQVLKQMSMRVKCILDTYFAMQRISKSK